MKGQTVHEDKSLQRINKSSSPSPEHHDVDEEFPAGQIWVQNNEIYVKATPGKTTLPYIYPTEPVRLFINGQLVKEKTVVSSEDHINVELKTEEQPLSLQIYKSKDGIVAYASVKLKTIKQYHLKDQLPSNQLILITTSTITKFFPLTLENILDKINQEGITYGVNYQAIEEFLKNPQDSTFEIARGVPPLKPVDDSVELLFDENITNHNADSQDKVNFFNLKQIPSVDKDVLLGIKHEGKPGQPGLSVTGKIILPEEPKKIIIQSGKGVRLEGNMVYSTKAGRPMVKKVGNTWLFYIEPHLVHRGDIDISTGNQDFRGNITVYGNINDGMTVRAGGNVQVFGYINRATVIAMESVWANKCIGAQVQGGGASYYIENCSFTLNKLYDNFKKLNKNINIIIEHPDFKEYRTKIGLLLLLLIEKKFPNTTDLLKKTVYYLEITPIDMPKEIEILIEKIKENIPPRDLSQEKLKILMEYIKFAQDFFEQIKNYSADVKVDYCANSTISSSRDVHISGQGCFSSQITAGRNVYVDGIFRGGSVKAKGDILINEVGSIIATKTVLKTETGKRIKILKRIYDGVIVIIGSQKYIVTSPMGAVEFSNYDDTKIRIVK
ncbi:DUF342 domain-containing protein [Desulfotruncus alcoholivorax]|uniref:DUF342 domain-containing protein n=1 Tax=Desulfotruncus alcoholivorax TaxID=265477 RepID=UPI0003FCA712|nr:FapA family protein [Desulfotruncus alcoholivorax]